MEFLEKKYFFSTDIVHNKENGCLELKILEDWHMAEPYLRKKQIQEEVDPSVMKNYTKFWDKAKK